MMLFSTASRHKATEIRYAQSHLARDISTLTKNSRARMARYFASTAWGLI